MKFAEYDKIYNWKSQNVTNSNTSLGSTASLPKFTKKKVVDSNILPEIKQNL